MKEKIKFDFFHSKKFIRSFDSVICACIKVLVDLRIRMSIKDFFKPIGVDKSIVIASSEAVNLNPREEAEFIKSIEEGVQSGGGGVSKRK